MPQKTLFHQLYPSYLLITFISLGAIGWYTVNSLREFYYEQTIKDLGSRARLVEEQVQHIFSEENSGRLQHLAGVLGRSASARITLVLPNGRVVGDSNEDPSRMDNHASRPEIQQALKGSQGVSMRPSKTLQTNLLYVAIPLKRDGDIIGVVRMSVPLMVIDQTLKGMSWKIVLAGLLIALVATPISLYISRRVSRPLSSMKEHAQRFARGNLSSRIQVQGSEDISSLAEALNEMAAQLDDRIRTITTQRNEHEAILSSMVEGVLAVDSAERIISLNQAAAKLLGIAPAEAPGRSIQEIVRNAQLQSFVKKALASEKTVEEDVVFATETEERYLQAVGTVLTDAGRKGIGAVIVLNDVTRLRRLENVRRDFVANVSHELRTPITSIKGFVETLIDHGMQPSDDTQRFLNIVSKQADRLNAIIEDLLSLSRIEQDAEKCEIVLETGRLRPVLEAAIQDCAGPAAEKSIRVDLECEPGLEASVNPPLIEHALVNLVGNAIKYSDEKSTVWVKAESDGRQLLLSVADEGCGIDQKHLPRLFERFYRVDKARSRQLGGTGLGLAIVNHITQAHSGTVSVESALGQGSVFKIHLPARITP